MGTTTLSVGGMTCGGCASNVSNALLSIQGVNSADVDHETGEAIVNHAQDSELAQLETAILQAGYTVGGQLPSTDFDWRDGPVWKQSAHNTKWCLIGCSIGDMGTIAFFQFVIPDSGWTTMSIMALAMFNGIMTSIALETFILLSQMPFKEAFRVAIGMSLISMISMEAAMNLVDWLLTGGAQLTWWVMPIMLIAGFITPWPYNYWRLKKFGKACH